jgi:hypothetical protein
MTFNPDLRWFYFLAQELLKELIGKLISQYKYYLAGIEHD